METVILKPLYHRNKECIGIYFPKNKEVQLIVQNCGGKWSKTHGCWYTVMNTGSYHQLIEALSGKVIIEGKELDPGGSKHDVRLSSREKITTNNLTVNISELKVNRPFFDPSDTSVCDENKQALQQYRQLLVLRSYSSSTVRTYTNEFIQFLKAIKENRADTFSSDRLKDYFEYCSTVLHLSEAVIHSRINAVKFYYEQVLGRDKFFWEIPRPKKPFQLPKVISKEEIATLINSIENKKHKTIIMLAYACGLRVSEVISLKVKNVDGNRKLLFIERSKGKKDRVVSLSPGMLIMLRDYYRHYKPEVYLFEGQYKNEHLSARSIQSVLRKAKAKAGIKQEGNMHLLRHSFATHLLDKGIDVVFIQKLLGHNDIKTTLKYLHVTNKDILHILSPLEDIEALLKK